MRLRTVPTDEIARHSLSLPLSLSLFLSQLESLRDYLVCSLYVYLMDRIDKRGIVR